MYRPGREVGQRLIFPNWEDAAPLKQVERNAEWIRKRIDPQTNPAIPIHRIAVLPGWFVGAVGDSLVKAMNEKYLAGYHTQLPKRVEDAPLRSNTARLEEHCRRPEF